MKKWFLSLDICYKTALVSAIVMLIALAGTSCLFFLGWREIPFGIILGCSVGIISYLLMGMVNVKTPKKPTGTIIMTIIRFVLIAAVLFMSAWFYYKLNLRLFNIFAVAGSYFIPTICLCIILVSGREGKVNV